MYKFLILLLLISNSAWAWSVKIQCDPNPPEENVTGYKVYYGTVQGGPYPNAVDTGQALAAPSTYTITGLQDGTVYYFVATAYNGYGLESAYSNEISSNGTPKNPSGLRIVPTP